MVAQLNYIEKAMGQTWYAWIFAIATIIACGVLLPTVQSNAIGNAVVQTFGPGTMIETSMGLLDSTKIITGAVIVTILGFIIFGGVKRIANFAQVVVPFMALAYIITAVVIVAINASELPGIIAMIFEDAFTPHGWLWRGDRLGGLNEVSTLTKRVKVLHRTLQQQPK